MKRNEKQKMHLDWLLNHLEECSERYIQSESLLFNILLMPWYKKIFIKRQLKEFLQSIRKYNF